MAAVVEVGDHMVVEGIVMDLLHQAMEGMEDHLLGETTVREVLVVVVVVVVAAAVTVDVDDPEVEVPNEEDSVHVLDIRVTSIIVNQ